MDDQRHQQHLNEDKSNIPYQIEEDVVDVSKNNVVDEIENDRQDY
jgi:hypothetical protein